MAIKLTGVGKRFHRYHGQRRRTLRSLFTRSRQKGGRPEGFWSLRDLDLEIGDGQMLGVVGRNGAGKTTLLQLIGGVLRPDEGTVECPGRIGALMNLGSASQLDLPGRDNIYINGVIAGMSRDGIRARFDDIVSFAELEAFIDSPVRTYSSGMQLRLAFAVIAHTEPKVLLVDEVLSVGDLGFQRKCIERIHEFKRDGFTIVFVSHDLGQICELCDEVIWLKDGRLVARGSADQITADYSAELSA